MPRPVSAHTLIKRCLTAAAHCRCRWPGVGPRHRDAVNVTEDKLVCMCCLPFSLVPYTDDREDAEPTDEQQHQESGQGMQLYCETAGRLGVHLHDSGQWGPTFPASKTTLWSGKWRYHHTFNQLLSHTEIYRSKQVSPALTQFYSSTYLLLCIYRQTFVIMGL